ncbi:procathepsin L-like [Chiloscyllium plagiosum]|uniref:procathepsin L-like n=1 Tax=Chiloscyllium plagiosum TaxID=36176 RepID=UPI001CB82793|nr:procathepsin L-like [Chiloscyllium plagiosum]
MKFSLFLGCVAVSILVVASGHTFNSTLDEDWKSWKSCYEKQYTQDEESYRRMVWEDNMRYIKQHNLEHSMGKHTFTVGMNQYGDLTTEEFNELMNGFFQDAADNSTEEDDDEGNGYDEDVDDLESDEIEESDDVMKYRKLDWRKKGLVTPVKKQGRCGSCWAFSVTGAIEGQWAKKCRRLVSLSEQNLLDCDTHSYGCMGGFKLSAFEYVKENGIQSEKAYPYIAKQSHCKFRKDKIAARIKKCNKVKKGEQNLAKALWKHGPIAVSLNSHPRSFHLYKQGVYSDPKCTQRRGHAVLVVGFGRENGINYWLVKNSWGTHWGEKGYIKIAKNRGNLCGIANYGVYPIVRKYMCKTLASSNST